MEQKWPVLMNRICRKEQVSFMNRQNHSEPENRLTLEEQQEFLKLLAQLSPEQREALKKVLKSFT